MAVPSSISQKPRISIVRPPVVVTRWSDGRIITSVRHSTPPNTEANLGGIVRAGAGFARIEPELEIIDARRLVMAETDPYKTIDYFKGTRIQCSFFGANEGQLCERLSGTDIVLVTSPTTLNREAAALVMRAARKANPKALVAVGGPDAGGDPSWYLDRGADIVATGKGYLTIPMILRCLRDGTGLGDVPAIAYRNGAGEVVRTPAEDTQAVYAVDAHGNVCRGMDHQPLPAYNLLDWRSYDQYHDSYVPPGVDQSHVYFWNSEGCPRSDCDFCFSSGKGFSRMSLEAVERRLSHLQSLGVTNIVDVTEAPTMRPRQELLGLYGLYKRMGMAYAFGVGVELSSLWNKSSKCPDRELIQAIFSHERGPDGKIVGAWGGFIPLEGVLPDRSYLGKAAGFESALSVIQEIIRTGMHELSFGLVIDHRMGKQDILGIQHLLTRVTQMVAAGNAVKKEQGREPTLVTMTPFVEIPNVAARNYGIIKEAGLLVYPPDRFSELYSFLTVPWRSSKDGLDGLDIVNVMHDMRSVLNGPELGKSYSTPAGGSAKQSFEVFDFSSPTR
jgi:hypothetical protein